MGVSVEVATLVSAHRRRAVPVLALLLLAVQPAAAQQEGRVVARTLFGEVALDIRVSSLGTVRVGMANDSAAVSLDFRVRDVRRFTDSLVLRLRSTGVSGWTIRVEEPGVGAGAMSLTRGAGKEPDFVLFGADESLAVVRQHLTKSEVSVLLRHLRSAVTPAPRAKKKGA